MVDELHYSDGVSQFIFYHPNYLLIDDEVIGHLYEEYSTAFVVFEINYN